MSDTREIFLVDDEVAFTELMATLLEAGAGRPVRAFNNPCEAVAALATANPAFIVSDLAMPEMNGFEFLRAVFRRRPDVPCLLVTGNHLEEGMVERNGTASLIGVLFKPVSWRDIALLIFEHTGNGCLTAPAVLRESGSIV